MEVREVSWAVVVKSSSWGWEAWVVAVPGTVAGGSGKLGEAPGGHAGKGRGNTMKSWT